MRNGIQNHHQSPTVGNNPDKFDADLQATLTKQITDSLFDEGSDPPSELQEKQICKIVSVRLLGDHGPAVFCVFLVCLLCHTHHTLTLCTITSRRPPSSTSAATSGRG